MHQSNSESSSPNSGAGSEGDNARGTRILFTMGGKGGTGKTTLMCALAEWFDENGIAAHRLDLDTENKVKGSLSHFFPKDCRKIDIQTRAGLDSLIDCAADNPPVILADMGASSGKITHGWFDDLAGSMPDTISFTAIGVVTADPASVESVLSWAARLQRRVRYLVVLNQQENEHATFNYWDSSVEAHSFRKIFSPPVISMGSRLPDLQHALRNHGLNLGAVARREAGDRDGLTKASMVVRAQSYRRQLFAEFARIKEVLVP